jgi:hypothetical protein
MPLARLSARLPQMVNEHGLPQFGSESKSYPLSQAGGMKRDSRMIVGLASIRVSIDGPENIFASASSLGVPGLPATGT